MGIATHLGPWVLGTVRSTTGTTAGTVRNTGPTTVMQYSTSSVAFNASAAATGIVIPAGSLITDVFIIQTVAFTGSPGTMSALINGTTFATSASVSTASTSNIVFAPSSTSATAGVGSSIWLNTGATDGIVTVTGATLTAGAGILCIHYAVRQPDGTYVPTSFTGP